MLDLLTFRICSNLRFVDPILFVICGPNAENFRQYTIFLLKKILVNAQFKVQNE